MTPRERYADCAARGLTVRETAAELGVSLPAARSARTRLELTFAAPPRPPITDETRAKMRAAKLGKRWSPEHRARIAAGVRRAYAEGRLARWHDALTPDELTDYRTLRKAYSRAEALAKVGREDLIP